MTINQTKYPNQERVVSGTYNVDPQDSVLLCNTSLAAVTINLATVTAGYWPTLYKLYIVDNSGNSAANNITIVAPSGYTINDAATLVLNVNGTSAIISISADTKYISTSSQSGVQPDSGWLDLQGFSWITTSALVPQYRVFNKQIMFRRNLVIPLFDGGGSVLNYAADGTYGTTYVNTALVAPWTGAAGISTFYGGCYFNNGNPVIASTHYPDADYHTPWIIASKSTIVVEGGATALYHSPYMLTLTTGGLLKLETINSKERSVFPAQLIGNSLLRQVNSKAIAGSFVENFNDVVDSTGTARTLTGSLINGYDFNQIDKVDYTHLTTFDPADETQFGAMSTPLMGFNAFKN